MASPDYQRSLQILDQFRNRRRTAGNLTRQNMAQQPVAPGPFANMRTGGGLALGQPETPALMSAMGRPAQTAPLGAPPPAYVSPRGIPSSANDVLGVANQGAIAASRVAAGSKYGTQATSRVADIAGVGEVAIPGLKGTGQGRAMDMEKRNAYLANRAQVMAGRREGVVANAIGRSQDRKERIADRKRGPSVLEMMASRNPRLAAQLAQIQGQRDIAGINAGGRKNIAEIEAGWRGGAQKGQQYATDVAADVAIMTSPDASPQDKLAAAQRVSAARVGGAQVGQAADTGKSLAEIPLDQKKQLDQAHPADAEAALRNMGVSPSAIARYKQQRQVEHKRAQGSNWSVKTLHPYGGLLGNIAARIRGLFDKPPVGVPPQVIERMTPAQRKQAGIPEPPPKKKEPPPLYRGRPLGRLL